MRVRIGVALLVMGMGVGMGGVSSAGAQPPPERSFERLVTGNGHFVASFDREAGRIDTFLEHPYRFFAPRNMPEDLCYEADESRDLAFDTYFGVRIDGAGTWLGEVAPTEARNRIGSNILDVTRYAGPGRAIAVRESYFAPTDLELPVLVMVAEATNESDAAHDVDLYGLFNFRLGDAAGGREPSADAEGLSWDDTRRAFYEFSDRSAGTMAYVPLGPVAHRTASGGEFGVYAALRAGRDLDDVSTNAGNDLAPGLQAPGVRLAPGASTSFAVAVVWALDEDAGPDVEAVRTWAGARTPADLVAGEETNWGDWHTAMPSGLSDAQQRLWLQSNVILRMGQVREPGRGFGQILASLPPGLGFVDAQWNIAWVRDMAYAVVGLLRAGHMDEAQAALRFQIEAGPGRRTVEVGGPYRISATRYFGNGEEETDCNADGPNIEFDGFGLYLWTLGEYLRAGGDESFLREIWPEVRTGVADVLVNLIDDDGIIEADSSIWEVHWNGRQKRFTYTSLAAARGLCDAAAIAERLGEDADAARYAEAGARVRDAVATLHVDERGALAQSREDLDRGTDYIDAAAIEAMNWGVVEPDGRVATATVRAILDNLTVETGVGLMRNDDGGWYDSQEWVFVDLRALPPLRAAGETERADDLQAWVEGQALANDHLFSELHTAAEGDYAGSIPMVGFGPGAYLVALEGGLNDAACGAYGDRVEGGEDAGPGGLDAGMSDAGPGGEDAGAMGTDAGVGTDAGPGGSDAGPGADAGFCFGSCPEDDGCGCRSAGRGDAFAGLLVFGALLWRRRVRS